MNQLSQAFSKIPLTSARGVFLKKTYTILLQSVGLFIAFEWFLFQAGFAKAITQFVFGTSWFLIMGGLMLLSWFATHSIETARTVEKQWVALMAYIGGKALIFCPMFYLIYSTQGADIILGACLATGAIFSALTFLVLKQKQDFSFLGPALSIGGICIIALMIFSALFGLNLGTFFVVGMIGFSCLTILYDTSNMLLHFPEDKPVLAALHLFSSLTLLLWYVLQFFMSQRD